MVSEYAFIDESTDFVTIYQLVHLCGLGKGEQCKFLSNSEKGWHCTEPNILKIGSTKNCVGPPTET
jgi:hypothetical protein